MGKCRGFVIVGAWIGFADRLQIVYEDGMKQVTADLTTKEKRIKARDQDSRTYIEYSDAIQQCFRHF
jgi:hypothetical protein